MSLPQQITSFTDPDMLRVGGDAENDREGLARNKAAAQDVVRVRTEASARAYAALAQGQVDRTRFNTQLAESSKRASNKISELRREAIDNPAASIAELARLEASALEEPRFLGGLVDDFTLRWVPLLNARALDAHAAQCETNTQIAAWEAVEGFADFVHFGGPLARALGPSTIETPPLIEERMTRLFACWREEREARMAADKAVQQLSSLDQARVKASI